MRFLILAATALLVVGCTEKPKGPQVVDLDGVLDVFLASLESLDNQITEPSERGELVIEPIEAEPEQAELEQTFAAHFAQQLNASPHRTHYDKPLGVTMEADGAFKGFEDPNANGTQDPLEKNVFKVELDTEGQRVVATDLQNEQYRRDGRLRVSGVGLFTGFMLGRMLGNQGKMGLSPTRFAGATMSPKGYHSTTGARRVSLGGGGARGAGGSRSFSSGK